MTHDQLTTSFLKSVLKDRETALALFQTHMYPEVSPLIDWNTFVIAGPIWKWKDEERKSIYQEVTYRALLKKNKGYIYLNARHQRKIDPLMFIHVEKHNIDIYQEYTNEIVKHTKQKNPKWPLVVNLVLYYGTKEDHTYHEDRFDYYPDPELARSVMTIPYIAIDLSAAPGEGQLSYVTSTGIEKQYPYPESIYDYYEDPELARSVMSKSYILVSLHKVSDEHLLSHGPCGLMEVLLKRANSANFASWLEANQSLLRSYPLVPYLGEGVAYALKVSKEDSAKIRKAFASIYPESTDAIIRAVT